MDISIDRRKSLLWKVSGNGLPFPSYIFGTMHLMCEDQFSIKPKILSALKKCSAYFMEVDLGSISEMENFETPPSQETKISDGLNDREKEELNEILTTQYGMTLEEADHQAPVLLINRMISETLDCESFKMAEIELLAIAQSSGKKSGGLETTQQQLKIADQVFDSKELLRQMRSAPEYTGLFEKMIQAYQSEDLQSLAELVNDQRFMSKKMYRILVSARNKRWAKSMPRLMKKERTFFAIGAGHLSGEEGVIYLLRQQGYAVNPVYR